MTEAARRIVQMAKEKAHRVGSSPRLLLYRAWEDICRLESFDEVAELGVGRVTRVGKGLWNRQYANSG